VAAAATSDSNAREELAAGAARHGWSSDGGKCCHGRGVWLSSMAVQISGAAGIVLGAETWRGAKGGRGKIAGRHGRKRWASCCSPWTTAARCGCCFMGKRGGEGPGRHGSYCCPWKINRTPEQQGKGGRPSTPATAMGKLESAMPLRADVAEQERDVELQVSHGRKTAGSLELLLGADGKAGGMGATAGRKLLRAAVRKTGIGSSQGGAMTGRGARLASSLEEGARRRGRLAAMGGPCALAGVRGRRRQGREALAAGKKGGVGMQNSQGQGRGIRIYRETLGLGFQLGPSGLGWAGPNTKSGRVKLFPE
jgi:hypothetical protein